MVTRYASHATRFCDAGSANPNQGSVYGDGETYYYYYYYSTTTTTTTTTTSTTSTTTTTATTTATTTYYYSDYYLLLQRLLLTTTATTTYFLDLHAEEQVRRRQPRVRSEGARAKLHDGNRRDEEQQHVEEQRVHHRVAWLG